MAGEKRLSQFDMKIHATELTHLVTLGQAMNMFMFKNIKKEPVRMVLDKNFGVMCLEIGTISITAADVATIDGVTPKVGDRVLITGLTLARRTYNGIYELVDVTSTSGKHLYKRAADFNESTDVMPGVKIPVLEGATYAGTTWKLTTPAPYIMNTTEFEFALDTDADERQVLQKEYTFDGDNVKTNFVCTHNWNTRFVHIQAVDENYKAIGVDWAATSVNDVTVYLNAPLATGSKLTIILQAMV